MGLFDAFRGSRKPAESTEGTASSSEITNAAADEQFSSAGASSSTSGAFSSTGDFSTPSFSDDESRFYNPYAGIQAALDKRDVKQGFKLPSSPEFLFSEESTVAVTSLPQLAFAAPQPRLGGPSMQGPDCRIARLNRPLATGATHRLHDRYPPELCPNSVTRVGSPPKSAMFFCTH